MSNISWFHARNRVTIPVDPPITVGIDGAVEGIMRQSTGKIIIVGRFSKVDGIAHKGVARLNVDGTVDNTFTPQASLALVYTLDIDASDRVYIGGYFLNVNGFSTRVARLNPDGTVDNTFTCSISGASSSVSFIKAKNDGTVIIGGSFTYCNSVAKGCIMKLTSTGANDTSFTGLGVSGTPGGTDPYIWGVFEQGDGKLIIAGVFLTCNSVSRISIARLNVDGTIDLTFTSPFVNTNDNGIYYSYAYRVIVEESGKILIGGNVYTSESPKYNKSLVRLSSTGAIDTVIVDQTTTYQSVQDMKIASGNKLLITGSGGYKVFKVDLALNILDPTFNIPVGNGDPRCIAEISDSKIMIGGFFTTINTKSRPYIARLNSDGTLN